MLKRIIDAVYQRSLRENLKKICDKIIKRKKTEKEYEFEKAFSKYPLLSYRLKQIIEMSKTKRKNYAWGVLCGADLAVTLGIKRISVIEFGVAEGAGLIVLEKISKEVEKIYNIIIDVYGFDTGKGLPRPIDYRDLPQIWKEGYFPMDEKKLRQKLDRAKLVLGLVNETIGKFIELNPAHIAFTAFDLDLYSSTMAAFQLFLSKSDILLPRVHCYFDDIMAFSYSDFNGERLAINDFNEKNNFRKISKIYGLRDWIFEYENWIEQIYLAHIFDHPLYGQNDGMLQQHIIRAE